jgi:hypothetical protein
LAEKVENVLKELSALKVYAWEVFNLGFSLNDEEEISLESFHHGAFKKLSLKELSSRSLEISNCSESFLSLNR